MKPAPRGLQISSRRFVAETRWLCCLAGMMFMIPLAADDPTTSLDAFDKIDCHVHLRYEGNQLAELARVMRFRLVNISTGHYESDWQATYARYQQAHFPGTVAFIASFTMKGFPEPWWSDATIGHIDRAVAHDDAIGVKIWKDVGMEYRKQSGPYVLVDDESMQPVLSHLEEQNLTLIMHIADPIEYWRKPDAIADENRRKRLVQRGGLYVMHDKVDAPSHEDLIAARDRVLQRHPKLKVVGAHLGSLEHDLDELAIRLDRYPNFAVDTAARMGDLAQYDRETLRSFLIRYQDRILYGTDMSIKPQHNGDNQRIRLLDRWQRDWNLLAGDAEVVYPAVRGEVKIQGLALPMPVLEKIYRKNALQWFPGLTR
tara:strand:+ start:158185 stop:159297 length:1113 start_codon:yes stop_codon:yes gene_type:complete